MGRRGVDSTRVMDAARLGTVRSLEMGKYTSQGYHG